MPFGDLGALAQWNPATNTPKLKSGVGQEGMIYRCSVSGTQALDDNSEWNQNDLVAYSALMGKWFRLGPVNIPTDTEVALGQDNQKVITSKKLAAAMAAWGFVNVKTYGATGDGVTDDTAACQAAIDAAAGKVLLWPAGTYMVTQLTARASSKWWGMGLAASVISRKGTAAQDLVVCQSIGWTSFNDLTFRGGDVPVSPAYSNVAMNLCTHCQFTDCYFDQFDKLGIGCQGCYNVDVENCWFIKTAMDHTGVNEGFLSGVSSGPSSNVTVRNSFFYNCGSIFQGSFPVFEFNYCSGWGYGAGCSTGTQSGDWYARIAFNYMASGPGLDNNPPTSDHFTLKGIENWSAYATIVGNICIGCSGPGIFNGGPYTTISGNTCVNNNSYGEPDSGGIVIAYFSPTNSGHNTTVTGNTCLDTGAGTQYYGVVVSSLCDNVTVSGNNLRGNVTAPFEIQGGTNASIFWDGFVNGVLNGDAWGIKGDGLTDNGALLNSGLAFIDANRGCEFALPGGTIKSSITVDHKYPNITVRGRGKTAIPGTYSFTEGTKLSASAAITLYKVRSPYGPTSPKLAGGGLVGITLDDGGVATRTLEVSSYSDFQWDILVNGTQGTEAVLFQSGVTGVDLVDPCDCQRHLGQIFINLLGSPAALAADGSVLSGSSNSNFSYNHDLEFIVWYKNGKAVKGVSGDNNKNMKVVAFRAAGGTGYTFYACGATASHPVGWDSNEMYIEGGGPIYAEGTGDPGVTGPVTNTIEWLDDGNGTPVPTAGTGSSWLWQSLLYGTQWGGTFGPTVVGDNQANIFAEKFNLGTASLRIFNASSNHCALTDGTNVWSLGIDGATGDLRIVRLAGAGNINLGNGVGAKIWTPGFNGAAIAAKPTVTGAKGGNAALTSFLSALATMGLITDSTT